MKLNSKDKAWERSQPNKPNQTNQTKPNKPNKPNNKIEGSEKTKTEVWIIDDVVRYFSTQREKKAQANAHSSSTATQQGNVSERVCA